MIKIPNKMSSALREGNRGTSVPEVEGESIKLRSHVITQIIDRFRKVPN